MRTAVALVRIVVALTVLAAVVATALDTASRTPLIPWNFFGFFTIQGNILLAAILLATGGLSLARRPQSGGLVLARGAATGYIAIVGVVYNLLLAGLAGGVALPWANTVMHVLFPLYGVLDWLLVGDRPPLPWRRLWVVVLYPVVWLVVVLVRGATDGWVPYPFLDPANGYGSVAVYVAAIAVAFVLAGALAWANSRLRILRPAP
ncbi:Pr6Pr family membrane protein [Rathayibacter sp. SD072]|uniref:Pr6Pr family membrane protein n=1 Tax=Rathayibacter sp. SD072 TaxID=2781731 RepID=UPI001A96AE44|nr:Pr6Pr family membrane protein [Rathayibacter sp. SD072]MBO0984542.1 Pr6Pr family membrane protein [Rathayibacter sp. SD072]